MNTTTEEITWPVGLKSNWGLLLVGIMSLLAGIWTDIQWISSHPSGMLYLLNLLPGALFLTAWYLAGKYSKRRWIIIIIGILSTLVISFFVFSLNVLMGAFVAATTPITDIARYSEIRAQMGDSELKRHFPLSIPENAENVQFEYLPKFMMGGSHFQLKLRLPQAEISDLLTEFRSQTKYRFIGGNSSDHANIEGGVPTTYFYTSGTDDHSFQDDYEILVLNAEPWNHGYSYGVVISLEKSEIIYWAEYW